MAYTTNTTTFNPDLNEIFEEAFERCGLELRTGYDFRTARRSMNFMLTDWANRGINMWTIEQGSIPLVQGQVTYALPDDTVDLIEHVIRTDANQGSNQTDLNITRISVSTYSTIPNKQAQGRPIQVWIQRLTANSSVVTAQLADYIQTYSTTIPVTSVVGLPSSGFIQLTDINNPTTTEVIGYNGIQLPTSNPVSDVNPAYLLDCARGQNGEGPFSFSPYTPIILSQKPSITVWPAPDQGTTAQPYYVFYYWRLRRIFDAGSGTNVIDIPFRFLNCMVAGLSYMLAIKKPEIPPDRIAMLKQQYDEAWEIAATEDREKAADRLVPRQSFIR
jgi:hypothetical protein